MGEWNFATELFNIVTKDVDKIIKELDDLYFSNPKEYMCCLNNAKQHYRIFRNQNGKHKALLKYN